MFMGQNVFKLRVLGFTGKCEAHIVAMASENQITNSRS